VDTEGFEKLIGRLYTAFILRDLTFFVSGGLVIIACLPKPVDMISRAMSDSDALQWLGIPAFLALSYVLGVLLQELVRLPLEPLSDWWVRRKRRGRDAPGRLVVRMEEVYQDRSLYTALGVERVLFLKQVAATQCSALAILTVLSGLGYHLILQLPWWLLLLVSLAWAAMYLDKTLQEDDILVGLKEMASSPSPTKPHEVREA
jgi:hypothetical protein